MNKKKISIVLSVYNEAQGLQNFNESLLSELEKIENYNFELVWVNDGSTDNSQQLLEAIKSTSKSNKINHQIIEFSKNYGHEVAMIAGVDHIAGNAVIIMDADGQHPPSILASMIIEYENGNDIILMRRTNLVKNNRLKSYFLSFAYQILNQILDIKLENNSPDFYLISDKVAKVLSVHFREKNRFIRGYIQSIGFRKKTLNFIVTERRFGLSSNNFFTLFQLAINAIFLFSTKPISLIIYCPLIIASCILLQVYHILQLNVVQVIGISIFAFSCIISIFGIYFKKVLVELRNRPLYIIKQHFI